MKRNVVKGKSACLVTIMPAVEDDAAGVLKLMQELCAENPNILITKDELPLNEEEERKILARYSHSNCLFTIAKVNSEIVGFLDLRRSRLERCAHTAELGLGVAKPYRGFGIGTAMINYSLEWAKKQGIRKVKLGVIASNARAYLLYKRLGFEECGRHRNEVKIDGAFEDLILMEKELI